MKRAFVERADMRIAIDLARLAKYCSARERHQASAVEDDAVACHPLGIGGEKQCGSSNITGLTESLQRHALSKLVSRFALPKQPSKISFYNRRRQ